ncbi:MAG: hypothetical protein K2O28_04800 [Clostridia bacterium]|nr:hypothetical protein [Clostridia bacterium]
MKIYCRTRKSHRWNEDRFINGRNYSIVLDGATPLKISGQFNEARWLVDYFKNNIKRHSGNIKSRLSKLCQDAYHNLPIEIKDEDYLPSASACWVEWNNDTIDIGILGDCEVTAVTYEDEYFRFYDDRLRVLDNIALNEMVAAAHKHGTTFLEARKYINDLLIKHRKLINKPNGYSAIALSPNAKICERAYSIKRDNIKTLYLYSDGFSQAFENLGIYKTHTEMFKQIESVDAEIAKIVAASFSDPNCNKHPRFKVIDDITVVKIDF